jgi:hypothetical protein
MDTMTSTSWKKEMQQNATSCHTPGTSQEEEPDLFPQQDGHGKLPLPLHAGHVVGLLLPAKGTTFWFRVPRDVHLTQGILVTPPHSIHKFKSLQPQKHFHTTHVQSICHGKLKIVNTRPSLGSFANEPQLGLGVERSFTCADLGQ